MPSNPLYHQTLMGQMIVDGLNAYNDRPCLYLGDTNTDMQTATAAGMFPVGALWGFRTAHELTAAGAKVLVEHPTQVLQYL